MAKSVTPLSAEERQKQLTAKLKSIGSLDDIIEGDAFDTKHQDYIPIDVLEVANVLGEIPGFALGNLVEFIGESGSGKSYLAYKVAACAQRKGMKVALFNIENSFYEPRANAIGVITRDKNLFQMWPNLGSGEKVCDTITAVVESGLYGVVIVDSITALIPSDSLEKDFNDPRKIGSHAVLIGDLAKKLTLLTAQSGTTAFLINQYRIGAGAIKNTFVKKGTGGEALFFYDHYRISFKKIGGEAGRIFNAEKEVIGGRSRITINKNRYGRSGDDVQAIFPIYFTKEESDPVADFIMRAKSRSFELIKEVGQKNKKKLQYVTEDGEIIEDTSVKTFIEKLTLTPAPSKKTRNDPSVNAFEYICRKIKLEDKSVEALLNKLNAMSQDTGYELPNNLVDYDPQDDFDE